MRKVKFLKTTVTACVAASVSAGLFAFDAVHPGKPIAKQSAKSVNVQVLKKPEDNRFVKTILYNDLNEPMELAVAKDGRVFFIERSGNFYAYTPSTKQTVLVHKFEVKAVEKILQGMLGMTIDPDFAINNYIYFYYSTNGGDGLVNRLSRFTISKTNVLNLASEKDLLDVTLDAEVSAHSGGGMDWDKNKNLYLSTGDNTVPFESEGFAPIDQRANRQTFDADVLPATLMICAVRCCVSTPKLMVLIPSRQETFSRKVLKRQSLKFM